jgi:hypothetical protein
MDLLHAPAALPSGKEHRQPLNMRLDGQQSRSGGLGEEKNILPLLGFEPRASDRPVRNLVAVRTPKSFYATRNSWKSNEV